MATTEKEKLLQNEHFAYKLKGLYLKDENLFYQVAEYVPSSIHINKQENLDMEYANSQLLNKGEEIFILKEKGADYLNEISTPSLLKKAKAKVKQFQIINDRESVCSYFQGLYLKNKFNLMFTNKYFLTDKLFLNVSSTTDEMGKIGKLLENVFEPLGGSLFKWEQFQSLTKQEKIILKLFGKGYTSKEIAEQLFISIHTVNTHKKHIHYKLGIKRNAELIKFSMLLDII